MIKVGDKVRKGKGSTEWTVLELQVGGTVAKISSGQVVTCAYVTKLTKI